MKKIQKNKLFFCATEQSGDNIGVQILSKLNKKKNKYIFDGVGGNKMSPTESTIPFSGAPKPSFTLNQPKSKPKPSNKGFKQEIKNLLKSDNKQSLKIEQK